MGRLTFDIPDTAHQVLKVLAANQGVTIKDFVLSRIASELDQADTGKIRLLADMDDWERTRKKLKLKRGSKSIREVIHEGHKW